METLSSAPQQTYLLGEMFSCVFGDFVAVADVEASMIGDVGVWGFFLNDHGQWSCICRGTLSRHVT